MSFGPGLSVYLIWRDYRRSRKARERAELFSRLFGTPIPVKANQIDWDAVARAVQVWWHFSHIPGGVNEFNNYKFGLAWSCLLPTEKDGVLRRIETQRRRQGDEGPVFPDGRLSFVQSLDKWAARIIEEGNAKFAAV